MKKFLIIILSFLCTCFVLSACSNNNHTHSWEEWRTVDEEFCIHTCECGSEEKLEHNYIDGKCTRCNYRMGTQGLIFTQKHTDGQIYFALSGLGSATEEHIVIPAYYQGLLVKEIDDSVFEESDIYAITIPDSVTTIGKNEFKNCKSLRHLDLGESVSLIGECSFWGCESLGSVYYNGSIDTWCKIDFQNASANPFCWATNFYIDSIKIEDVVIPNTVSTIKNYAFYGMDCLQSVQISDSVSSIGDYAFYECYKIKELILGNNIDTIGDSAFERCTRLFTLTIPDSVSTIGARAFFDCITLRTVTIGSSISSLGIDTFSYCRNIIEVYNKSSLEINNIGLNIYTPTYGESKIFLDNGFMFYLDEVVQLVGYEKSEKEIVLPDSCQGRPYDIYKNAFENRTELEKIVIGDNVSIVGVSAFSGCYNLETMVIGKGIEKFSEGAFWLCQKTIDMYYAGTIEDWCNVIFDGSHIKGFNLFIDNEIVQDLEIPDTVVEIAEGAFNYCQSILSLILPKSIAIINYGVFLGCMNLKTVYYNGTVDELQAVYLQPNWKGNTPINIIHCIDGNVTV